MHETLLQTGDTLFTEIKEEMPEHILLLFGEIVHLVINLQVMQIGEEFHRIGHTFVDVVEIGQQDLAPTEKMVETFFIFFT